MTRSLRYNYLNTVLKETVDKLSLKLAEFEEDKERTASRVASKIAGLEQDKAIQQAYAADYYSALLKQEQENTDLRKAHGRQTSFYALLIAGLSLNICYNKANTTIETNHGVSADPFADYYLYDRLTDNSFQQRYEDCEYQRMEDRMTIDGNILWEDEMTEKIEELNEKIDELKTDLNEKEEEKETFLNMLTTCQSDIEVFRDENTEFERYFDVLEEDLKTQYTDRVEAFEWKVATMDYSTLCPDNLVEKNIDLEYNLSKLQIEFEDYKNTCENEAKFSRFNNEKIIYDLESKVRELTDELSYSDETLCQEQLAQKRDTCKQDLAQAKESLAQANELLVKQNKLLAVHIAKNGYDFFGGKLW